MMAETTDDSAPLPTAEPRGRRCRSRWLLRTFLCLLLLAGIAIAFLPRILSTNFSREKLESLIGAGLAAPFEIGELSLSWLGVQRLDNLRIGPPTADKGASAEDEILSINSARVEVGLLPLLAGEGAVTIVVDGVDVFVHRDADGIFNFEKILPLKIEHTSSGDKESKEGDKDPRKGNDTQSPQDVQLDIHSSFRTVIFELKNSRARYQDDVDKSSVEFAPIKVSSSVNSSHSRLSVLIVAKGAEEIPESAALKVDLVLEDLGRATSVEDLKLRGSLELEGRVQYDDVQIDSAKVELSLENGKMVANNVVATVNGGEVRGGDIFADLSQRPPPFKIEAVVSGSEVRHDVTSILAYVLPFIASDRPSDFQGTLDARVVIEGMGLSREEIGKHLTGSGYVRVRESRLVGSNFLRELSRFIGTDLGDLLVSEMGSDFQISDGKVLTRDLFLKPHEESKIRNLGLEGTTYFDGRLDFGVNLSALEETIGDKKIRQLLRGAKKIFGNDVLPLKLGGTLTSPKLVLEPRALSSAHNAPPDDVLGGVIDLVNEKRRERNEDKSERRRVRKEKRQSQGTNDQDGRPRNPDVQRAEKVSSVVKLKEVLRLKKPNQNFRTDLNPAGKPITIGARCTPQAEDGVVIAHGGATSGYSLTLRNGYPCFSVRNQGKLTQARGTVKVPIGEVTHIAGILHADGTIEALVDGDVVASASGSLITSTLDDGLSIGVDTGSYVGDYDSDMPFEGNLRAIRVYWGVLGPKALRKWAKGRSARR